MADLMYHAPLTLFILALCAVFLSTGGARATAETPRVAVVIGETADPLERFAAEELCGYLAKLFGIRARAASLAPGTEPLILVGRQETNPHIASATRRRPLPRLSGQGLALRRIQYRGRPTLVMTGGSPQAVLWAVYELAERWGVRYLLDRDVLPPRRGFRLPNLDVVIEPVLTVRQWRVINDFANGPESWGMSDYRPLIDQLAKLKFNRLFLSVWTWQPFLRLEFKGIKSSQAWLWYDYHYPITDDMVGRRLFGNQKEFWNPDLPLGVPYDKFADAGERLIHSIIDYAHKRGMQCAMTVNLTEFPREFAPVVPDAQKVQQLGGLTIVPGPQSDVADPVLAELAATVLRTAVNTYPELDLVVLGMPEWRQWAGQYERAWRELDARYDVQEVRPLTEVITAAQGRADYPGGAERAVQEAKGDIVALRFYDRLLREQHVLEGTRRPDMKFIFTSVAEELFPVVPRILPPGSEALDFIDYTPSRIVRRREAIGRPSRQEIPRSLIFTLEDDNVGVLPQLTTGSLHELTQDLRRYGWAGYSTRYWQVADHDGCAAYIARAAWDKPATPQAIYADQVRAVCGASCVDDMLTAFREVEAVTVTLEQQGLGETFPVPGMIMKNWNAGPMPAHLVTVRQGYRRALDAARRAAIKTTPGGTAYVGYWVGRLEFAIGYLDAVEAVRNAATAEAKGDQAETARWAGESVRRARCALEAYAAVARDQSDRGAIAVMNEYVYRPLKAKVAELGGKP